MAMEQGSWQVPGGDREGGSFSVARDGSVQPSARSDLPWVVLDAEGNEVRSASAWLMDLYLTDYPASTLRSYAFDLLSWHRFLWAVGVPWQQATRAEVRDWVRWMRTTENVQRRRSGRGRPAPGTVNVLTGKPYLPEGLAPSTINHALSTLTSFYEFAVEGDLGPMVNPVPRTRADRERVFAHRSPALPRVYGPRAPYRQKEQVRIPRQLSDQLFEEFFTVLPSNRDRAIVATAVSSGARAGEMLSMRPVDMDVDELTISVIPKGSRHRSPVRASPDAFMWITLAMAEAPSAPQGPLWQTRTRVPRPLTYWALRQVLERANAALGSNITFHDLRHTYCYRLLENPELLIIEVQELMRHKRLASTEIYMRARMDDLVAKLVAHYARPPAAPPAPAVGYDRADMSVLFPGTFQ